MDATETLDNTARGHAAPVPARAPRPVPAFAFDAVMGVVLMLAISVAFGIGWTMASTGAPGTMSLLWMTALGMGGAALLMYFWRRRATPAERAASARAARLSSSFWALRRSLRAAMHFEHSLRPVDVSCTRFFVIGASHT